MFVADGISSVGGNLTDETVERYGQLGGSLASKLDSLYEQVALKRHKNQETITLLTPRRWRKLWMI